MKIIIDDTEKAYKLIQRLHIAMSGGNTEFFMNFGHGVKFKFQVIRWRREEKVDSILMPVGESPIRHTIIDIEEIAITEWK